jgi:hypothetical protein
MWRHLRNTAVAATVLCLWVVTPIIAHAQTDIPPSLDYPPVGTVQFFVPAGNPAQSVPGYTTAQQSPAQFSTAQPYTGGVPFAGVTQPGYGSAPQPTTVRPSSQPSTQASVNTTQPSYISRPSYTSVVPGGSLARPSWASVASPITMSRPVKVSYPSWVTSVPDRVIAQPSNATVQQRGNFGQLPQSNGPQNRFGPFMVVPGSFPPGYFNSSAFAPNSYFYNRR